MAVVAAIFYVDGHGIHLAANSIGADPISPPSAAARAYFFDERLGHIEWHAGWIGLLAAFVVAETQRTPIRPLFAIGTAGLLGPILAATTIEGQTWWLVLGATPLFVLRAVRRRGHVTVACAASLTVAALAIGVWAIWWGGVPQITEVAWAQLAS